RRRGGSHECGPRTVPGHRATFRDVRDTDVRRLARAGALRRVAHGAQGRRGASCLDDESNKRYLAPGSLLPSIRLLPFSLFLSLTRRDNYGLYLSVRAISAALGHFPLPLRLRQIEARGIFPADLPQEILGSVAVEHERWRGIGVRQALFVDAHEG